MVLILIISDPSALYKAVLDQMTKIIRLKVTKKCEISNIFIKHNQKII